MTPADAAPPAPGSLLAESPAVLRWLTELALPSASPSPEEAAQALALYQRGVAACNRCPPLAEARANTVFGVGNPQPRICLVGEAPGANEDRLGEPFVGEAGQLLTKILAALGLRRDEVYIANVLKCRPPDNRRPLPEEVDHCRPWLMAQLAILKPQVICCLGATAAHALLGTAEPMAALRGRVFDLGGVPVRCTYHPAYLLRNPEKKREVWHDMRQMAQSLGLSLPEVQAP